MSYDVALFFPQALFPLEQWRQAIASFGPQESEARQSQHNRSALAEWTVSRDQSYLWMELRDVRFGHRPRPSQAQWQVFVSRGGHRPQGAWL